jgi:hypothetical protein
LLLTCFVAAGAILQVYLQVSFDSFGNLSAYLNACQGLARDQLRFYFSGRKLRDTHTPATLFKFGRPMQGTKILQRTLSSNIFIV